MHVFDEKDANMASVLVFGVFIMNVLKFYSNENRSNNLNKKKNERTSTEETSFIDHVGFDAGRC